MFSDVLKKDEKFKLLVPTNFSGAGANAAAFAIGLFKKRTDELVLENVFQAPKQVSSTLISISDLLANESRALLEKERRHLMTEYKGINISIDSEEGSIVHAIKRTIKEKGIDLLVLGLPKDANDLRNIPKVLTEQPIYWPMLTVPYNSITAKSKELVIIISEEDKGYDPLELEKYLKQIELNKNKAHHVEFKLNDSGAQLQAYLLELVKKHKIGLLVFNTSKGDRLQRAIIRHEMDTIILKIPAILMQHNSTH